jgi:phosphoglycerate kinase
MNLEVPGVESVEVRGKRVLVRVDFNIPLIDGRVSDDTRLRASLPTIEYLCREEATVILCSHLGRPAGIPQDTLRLKPIADHLGNLLGQPVKYSRDCVGDQTKKDCDDTEPGKVILLENLRFHSGEEKNDPIFAHALASNAEIFVNDAFGSMHRSHASTVGVASCLPGYTGFLVDRELTMLSTVRDNPQRPFSMILGGAKVSDKLPLLTNLIDRVDTILIGGGMVATFLHAAGYQIDEDLIDKQSIGTTSKIIEMARQRNVELVLPKDVIVARDFTENAPHHTVPVDAIPSGHLIADVGPFTTTEFHAALAKAKTIFWNGPLGVFELTPFSSGTRLLAECIVRIPDATTVVGGGSTAEAISSLGLEHQVTHVSTGGGASLDFLGGANLPGLEALKRNLHR